MSDPAQRHREPTGVPAEEGAQVMVRRLAADDLPAAAQLHATELADGFFAQLGPGFMRSYLSTFLDTPGAVALTAERTDGGFAGFLVGSTAAGHNRVALRRHWRRLLPAALQALALRPWLVVPFVRTRALRYLQGMVAVVRRRPAASGRAPSAGRPAVLLHIAVDPDDRGRGAGAALVQAFVDAAREAGCARAVLVAFGGDKDFYLRQGWQRLAGREDDDGRVVVTYGRQL